MTNDNDGGAGLGAYGNVSDGAGVGGDGMSDDEIKAYFERLNALRGKLDDIEPDTEKTWKPGEVRAVVDGARSSVLTPLDGVVEFVRRDDAGAANAIAMAALNVVSDAAGLAIAAGDVESGKRLLKDAKQSAVGTLGSTSPLALELAAALESPQGWALLTHGRWLFSRNRPGRAEKQLKKARKLVGANGALKQFIVAALNGPRPIGSMPTLTTINGIGTKLYGARDRWSDGSAIATLFFCVIYIPIIPLAAYRVIDDGGSYRVLAKYPLGPIARGWLAMLGVGALLLVGSLAVSAYLDSPGVRFARRAEAVAAVVAAAGANDTGSVSRDAAAAAIEELLVDNPDGPGSDMVEWAQQLVELRMGAQAVARPLDETGAPKALEALASVKRLPPVAKRGVADDVVKRTREWLGDLEKRGDANQAALDARLALAKRANAALDRRDFDGVKSALELKAALVGSEQWPAAAVGRLARIDAPTSESIRASLQLLAQAPSAGALATVEAQAQAALAQSEKEALGNPELLALHATVGDKLAKLASWRDPKTKEGKERAAAFVAAPAAGAPEGAEVEEGAEEGGATAKPPSAKALAAAQAARAKWLAKHPDDQELAAQAALEALSVGKLAVAQKLAAGAGPRGWHGFDMLSVDADIALESGDLIVADELLDRALGERLPEFARVASELEAQAKALEDKLISQANHNGLPPNIQARLEGAQGDSEKQGRIFSEHYREVAATYQPLVALRARFVVLAPVVETALRSGTIKVRRAAQAADADEEKRLLSAAEQVFLSIGSAASDDPTYQLGLGEVKYRIRQAEEGQRLLEAAAARGEPMLTLRVAQIYRGVGENERARTTARKVFDGNPAKSPPRMNAASFLAHMSRDVDEELKYLEECDAGSDVVKAQLATARGKKHMQDGKEKEADAEFAKSIAIHEKDAATNDAAANNAAVAYLARYGLTGDIGHIKKARAHFDKAFRLAPSSQIVVGNVIGLTMQETSLQALAPLLDLATLRPDAGDARFLVAQLRPGASGVDVDALLTAPALERLADQQRVLAPTNPDGWQALSKIYERRKDAAALARLEKSMSEVKLDTSDGAKAYAEFKFADAVASADIALARLEAMKGKLKAKDSATKGALAALTAKLLAGRGLMARDAQNLVDAIALAEQAERLWPALDLRSMRRDALLQLGLVRVAADDDAVGQQYEKLAWSGDKLPLAFAAGRFADVKRALASSKEWQQAAALSAEMRADAKAAAGDGEPSFTHYALALAVGDDAGAAREKAALLEQPHRAIGARIDALIAPYSESEQDFAAVARQLSAP